MTSIRIEAENYKSAYDTTPGNRGDRGRNTTLDNVDITSSTDVGGGSMVGWTELGEYLNYDVTVATPGTYDIVLRVASGDSDARVGVSIGGSQQVFDIGSTGGWNSWRDVKISGVSLSGGQQNLRLDILGGRPLLNYTELTLTSGNGGNTGGGDGVTPPPTGVTMRVEAEDYIGFKDATSGNRGGEYRSDDVDITKFTGASNGHAVGWTQQGEQLTYGFNIATAGTYDIIVRAASGDANNRLKIAGKAQTFGSTGGWNSLQDIRISGVDLAAGPQNLNLDVLAGRPILDYVEVVATGTGGGDGSTPPPTGVSTRAEAEDYIGFKDATPGNRGGEYRSDDVDITKFAGASNGHAVGWTQQGEQLTYGFNIAVAGTYDIIVRAASDDPSNRLKIGGKSVDFGSTGGWNSLQDIRISGVNLSAGQQNLNLDILDGRPILDYIEVVPTGTGGGGNTPPTGVLKIMPLGDSNTAGRPDRGSYRSTLQQLLAGDGFNVDFVGSSTGGAPADDRDHEGHSGFTINDISRNIGRWLSAKPDVVLLMLGTNDVLQDKGDNGEPQGASGRLGNLINKITGQLPRTKVLVASIPPLTLTSADLNQVKAFNSKVANLVRSKGQNVKFVDMYSALSPGDLLSDKIHLTKNGSAKAAKVWRNAIVSNISGSQPRQINDIESDVITNPSTIKGTLRNDVLTGDSGANILKSFRGDDILEGGGGKDTFILNTGRGRDTILDFNVGQDLLGLSRKIAFKQLAIMQGTGRRADDAYIFKGRDQLAVLNDVKASSLTASSFTRV